ncbi:MAG: type II 3-dehydroquinate dehydratase [Candidatus Competibacterales bacterium]
MAKLLVLNGPNLNLLGHREPTLYGSVTLDDIRRRCEAVVAATPHDLAFFQSNAEHQLVERVHQAAAEAVAWIIANPAAYTHTSIALRDALLATAIPFIEVHLSNVYAREAFRQRSLLADVAQGVIAGLGPLGYELALRAACARLAEES